MKNSARMSPDLERLLCEEFPLLFRMSHLQSPDMCCGWKGIRCHDGWYELIRDLSKKIVRHAERNRLDPIVRKISSYAALLTFEVEGADEHIRELCRQARESSSRISEFCGEPGGFSSSPPYEIRVCCPKHVVVKDDRPLLPEEISRLSLFNQWMRELQKEITREGQRQVGILSVRVADPLDPFDDFEIEAKVNFSLRPEDPEYRDDDDNFLTSRRYYIPKDLNETTIFDLNEDWGVGEMHFGVENHSYIFHDLCDHGYGSGQQQLSPRDILRIGESWIDIEIKAQMFRKLP